jgi:metal-responsive CopG/Arc/MetJ family transcriptional regulator
MSPAKPSVKFGNRRRDNPISVYFSEEVRALIEDLAKEYPGIQSRSRLIETLARYGLEQIRQSKDAKKEYEKNLVSAI